MTLDLLQWVEGGFSILIKTTFFEGKIIFFGGGVFKNYFDWSNKCNLEKLFGYFSNQKLKNFYNVPVLKIFRAYKCSESVLFK